VELLVGVVHVVEVAFHVAQALLRLLQLTLQLGVLPTAL
jgi:hypothetical protein